MTSLRLEKDKGRIREFRRESTLVANKQRNYTLNNRGAYQAGLSFTEFSIGFKKGKFPVVFITAYLYVPFHNSRTVKDETFSVYCPGFSRKFLGELGNFLENPEIFRRTRRNFYV